ncbi:MAG: hypothetical protein V1926_00990 [Candidatus Peregrinibacteria bacterium]
MHGPFHGTLTIKNHIPLKKGMGSSTALVVAITRCLLGQGKRAEALAIENQVNPGGSGIDFEVIWTEKPILFRKDTEPKPIALPADLLKNALLIDTGEPNETTPELVAWVKGRAEDPRVKQALMMIGKCAERLQKGEDIRTVLRDHHRAQIALGVVPKPVQMLIKEIERLGGAAKVLGAGGKSGGGGIIWAIHKNPILILPFIRKHAQSVLPFNALP